MVVISSPSFITPHLLVSEIADSIAWGCLLLLNCNVYCYYCGKFIEKVSFVFIGCCVSELHAHLYPYCNVWPEAVFCCFTRITLFTKFFTYMYDQN